MFKSAVVGKVLLMNLAAIVKIDTAFLCKVLSYAGVRFVFWREVLLVIPGKS